MAYVRMVKADSAREAIALWAAGEGMKVQSVTEERTWIGVCIGVAAGTPHKTEVTATRTPGGEHWFVVREPQGGTRGK